MDSGIGQAKVKKDLNVLNTDLDAHVQMLHADVIELKQGLKNRWSSGTISQRFI